MIQGKLPAQREKAAHPSGHLPSSRVGSCAYRLMSERTCVMQVREDTTVFLGSARLPSQSGRYWNMGDWRRLGTSTGTGFALGPALRSGDGMRAHRYSLTLWELTCRTTDRTGIQRVWPASDHLTKMFPLNYHWAPAPGTPMADLYPPQHILAQTEASLRRLETDCLDALLFQTWCPT
jgi:hypothetical protein